MTDAGSFEQMLARDVAKERRIFWYELAVGSAVAFALLAYLIVT